MISQIGTHLYNIINIFKDLSDIMLSILGFDFIKIKIIKKLNDI